MSVRNLGKRVRAGSSDLPVHVIIVRSFVELGHTICRTTHDTVMTRFLIALALYSAAGGATITMATTFFNVQLDLDGSTIGMLMLATIMFGIVGALLFQRVGSWIGFSRALAMSYLLWIITLVLSFILLLDASSSIWLILIVPLLGLSFGGSLTLARAVFASMIPVSFEAEYFGLFNFAQVSLGWLATLVFAAVNEATNSLRWGLLSQTLMLLIAFVLQTSLNESLVLQRDHDQRDDDEHHPVPITTPGEPTPNGACTPQ